MGSREDVKRPRQARGVGRPRDAGLDKAILDATIRLLARHGFVRLTVEMVAREARSTRPAIYRRYANKEQLVVAAMEHIRGPLPTVSTGELRTDLVNELRAFQNRIRSPSSIAMFGTVLAEEAHHPKLLALYREKMAWPRREHIKAVLCRIPGVGKLNANQNAFLDDVVNMAIGSYYAHYVQRGHPDAGWPERIADILIHGIVDRSDLTARPSRQPTGHAHAGSTPKRSTPTMPRKRQSDR